MPLIEEFRKTGDWFFRWRSYLPLALLTLVVWFLHRFKYPYDNHSLDRAWEGGCLLLSLCGVAVRMITAGYAPRRTSGKNTRKQVAEQLNTTGMYSIVRHPLYLGNFLIGLGVIAFVRSPACLVIYLLAFTLYYERIMFAEESFLRERFGSDYEEWARRTPAFLPEIQQWQKPEWPFSWRTVLRREYHSVLVPVGAMFLIEIAGDLRVRHKLVLDPLWVTILGLTLVFYGTMRIIAKKTHWLKVAGR